MKIPGPVLSVVVLGALGAGSRIAIAEPCIPRAWGPSEGTEYALRASGGGLSLCATPQGDGEQPESGWSRCWGVDPRTAALTPFTGLVPGQSVAADACKLGYCRQPRTGTDAGAQNARIALSGDGALVGVLPQTDAGSEEVIEIYDARTKKFVREIKVQDPGSKDETTNPEGVSDLQIAGSFIFVDGFISGPTFRSVWQYRITGEPLGKLFHDPEHLWSLNVSQLVQRDATTLVARDSGYQQVTVDLASGARTREVLPVPAGCKKDQLGASMWIDNAGEPGPAGEIKVTKKCRTAIRAAQGKLWKPLGVELDGVRYSLDYAKRGVKLAAQPVASRKAPRTIALPVCRK